MKKILLWFLDCGRMSLFTVIICFDAIDSWYGFVIFLLMYQLAWMVLALPELIHSLRKGDVHSESDQFLIGEDGYESSQGEIQNDWGYDGGGD